MHSFRLRPQRDYLYLTLFYLAVQALPWIWLGDGRHFHWEIIQAKKLMDYGFLARKGAVLTYGAYAGILPNPGDFNYVNHPLPILWLYTLLYALFGKAGDYALIGIGGLAASLVTYKFLKTYFPIKIAVLATVLFITAHASVEFAINTDDVAQGTIIWPLATLAILGLRSLNPRIKAAAPWLLALAVFASGQVFWLAMSAVPTLLLLCLPEEMTLAQAIRRPWSVPGWIPVIVGGSASLLLYIGQVIIYTPSLHGNASYLQTQLGLGGGFLKTRVHMLSVLVLRMILAGPALWFGTLIAFTQLRKLTRKGPEWNLILAMLTYLAAFAFVMFALPRFLFLNQHGFRFPLFPCAVLTAFALTHFGARWVRVAVIAIALPGLLLCYAKLHDNRASMASMSLGKWVAANTRPDEILFSNLLYLTPPVQSWDGEFINNIRQVADRFVESGVADQRGLVKGAQQFRGQLRSAAFVEELSQPIDPALAQKLESEAQSIISGKIVVPPEGRALFKEARSFVWSLLGKNSVQYAPNPTSEVKVLDSFNVKIYHFSAETVERLNKEALAEP